MYYISQIQKGDCGFACLKMVLANLNKDENYLYLPQDEYHGYYSFENLKGIAKKYGLHLSGIYVEKKESVISGVNFPIIAVISLKNTQKHAIVITKIKKKRVYYLDPARGSGVMTFKEFISVWDGTCLIIDHFKEQKCPYKQVKPLSAFSKYSLSFLQFLAATLAVVGVYFINKETSLLIPIIFLSLAVLIEIIMKAVSYALMKKLDKYFFGEERMPLVRVRQYLEIYENYKRLSLSSPLNFTLTFVLLIGLVVVVLMNDLNNGLLVLIPVTLVVFHHLAIKPILKRREKQISDYEESLDSAKDRLELQNRVKKLHKEAYRYSYVEVISRYVYGLLIIVATMLTMKLSGLSSVPYVIFYSCISFMIYRSLDTLFSYQEKIHEFNKVKVKIGNHITREKENR